jgi:hypothetical protein
MRKIFRFSFAESRVSLRASRLMQRGVRVVTNVEAGCDGRGGCARRAQAAADGEVVWSWRPKAGAKLAKTLSRLADDGGNKVWFTGESAKDTVKTNRAGKAGISGYTCGSCPVHFFTHGGHGYQPIPGLPCALS